MSLDTVEQKYERREAAPEVEVGRVNRPEPKLRLPMLRYLRPVWAVLVGGIFCQYMLTSILAVGWAYRYMQRVALKQWWKMGDELGRGKSFDSFLMEHGGDDEHSRLPNWFVRYDARNATRRDLREEPGVFGKIKLVFRGAGASLWRNGVLGVQAIFNIWVFTILPALLWQFGWYSGWDNSFNKGYEQFNVGQLISLSGILLFLVVMLYVPMALSRQAVTGNWKSFYDFKVVWTLVQQRRLASLFLAGVFSLVSLPFAILKTVPLFRSMANFETESMTATELLAWLNSYFFWVSVAGFIAFVFVRHVAVRIYAGAVVSALKTETLSEGDLSELESRTLNALGLVPERGQFSRHRVVELVGKATRPPWRVTITIATLLVWFSFVAQIYVSEFLNYHPQRGFVNQPIIQMPWFRYVPSALEAEAKAEASGAVTLD